MADAGCFAFAVMMSSWNQKGTRNGSLGFTGYGSATSGLMAAEPSLHVTQLVRR